MPVPAKWIRNPSDELAVREGCSFSVPHGKRVIEFLERFCRQSKGQWAGQPLRLMPWQKDFLMRAYGWRRADGTRRFRKIYKEVPKKNGKSTEISGLSLYHEIADDEPGAEVYVNAYDLSQARIVFDEALRMVQASPSLSKILTVVQSQKRIVHAPSNSILRALSADVPSKDGVNSSCTIFDELHRQATPAMWRIFRYAGAARRQPVLWSITTAGSDRESVCWQEHDYTERVNAGLIEDTEHLGIIYGASIDDDFEDPAVWRKANPSMGITINEDDFRRAVQEVKDKPTELNEFLRLRLNVWTQAHGRFIARHKWDACATYPIPLDVLRGHPCYAGLDLSSTTDLTALCLVFDLEDGCYYAHWLFWAPEDGAQYREEKERAPYLTWARQGWLTLTPGDAVDYERVREDVLDLLQGHELRKLYCDPYNATQLSQQLVGAGLSVEYIRQGFLSLNAPCKELERLVLGGKLRHGNNPVANWCCDNCEAERDSAGNVKLSKKRSREKIDGMAALVNALAGVVSEPVEEQCVYETQELRSL